MSAGHSLTWSGYGARHLRCRVPQFLADIRRDDDAIHALLARKVLFHPAHVTKNRSAAAGHERLLNLAWFSPWRTRISLQL